MVYNTQGVALGWDVMPRWGILEFGFKTDAPLGHYGVWF